MSVENRTRLEVQTVLRSCILEYFTKSSQTGWDAVEFGNFNKVNTDKVVTMNYIRSKDVGWQYCVYDGSPLLRKDQKITQQDWQIQVILKRSASTGDGATLAEDIAENLIMWFNGIGCEYLRKNGMANLRIDTNSVIVYNDNSDLYQKRAVFTVKIQMQKELITDEHEIEAIKPDVMPV